MRMVSLKFKTTGRIVKISRTFALISYTHTNRGQMVRIFIFIDMQQTRFYVGHRDTVG